MTIKNYLCRKSFWLKMIFGKFLCLFLRLPPFLGCCAVGKGQAFLVYLNLDYNTSYSANILFIIIAGYYVSKKCQRIFKLHNVPLMRKIREIWNEYLCDGTIMFIAWHMPFGSVHVFLVWRRIHQNLISGGHETTDVLLILQVCDVIFLYAGKTNFLVFLGSSTFLTPCKTPRTPPPRLDSVH